MGLSLVAMVVAGLGGLRPAVGALLQEGIDVAVILNALRVLSGPAGGGLLAGDDAVLGHRFRAEHTVLRPDLDTIVAAADALGTVSPSEALARVRSVHGFLVDELLPHEEAEEHELYPVMARVLGGQDPTGTMSRAHAEIARLVRRIGRLLDGIGPEGPDQDEVNELRRTLYGLHAILVLHFAQEDEGYLSLAESGSERP
jgi:iron-sulfur cluster repair protein YtfE (RIC family)